MKSKKDTINNVKILMLALIFGLGASVASGAWVAPAVNPVNGDCDETKNNGCFTPINVGPGEDGNPQEKIGTLILGSGVADTGMSLYLSGGRMAVGVGAGGATEMLDVAGYIKGRTGLCIGDDCRTSWPASPGTIFVPIPTGFVVAFDLLESDHCPDGWSDFDDADGRMIVGDGGSFSYEDEGGAKSIVQTPSQVGVHSHTMSSPTQYVTNFGQNGSSNCCNQQDNIITVGQFQQPYATTYAGSGSPEAMNIMNPYVTLKYCRKM